MTITKQVETATVVGTITGTGNASVTVTARGMNGSPKTISVAVTSGDTASLVGAAIRLALATDADVAALFLTGGSGANITLTSHTYAANDSTLNIAIANGTCTGLTAAPTSTNTTAGDGLENAYCTLAEIKHAGALGFTTDTTYDDLLTIAINDASRQIDEWTGRRFYYTLETRYYRAVDSADRRCLPVFDIANTTSFALVTDNDGDGTHENTWASTDYDFGPYNAALDGKPYTELHVKQNSSLYFPNIHKGTKVTANFGYPSIPKQVNRVCILQAERVFKRYVTVLGVSGATAIGTVSLKIPDLDSDIARPLMNLVRYD
ncbi:MAG TPA: hypothetical protein VFU31_05475 [Candidatus Binatia bacterium]|nr:hypothetical protein [Candidatus Binatia bacterium]